MATLTLRTPLTQRPDPAQIAQRHWLARHDRKMAHFWAALNRGILPSEWARKQQARREATHDPMGDWHGRNK